MPSLTVRRVCLKVLSAGKGKTQPVQTRRSHNGPLMAIVRQNVCRMSSVKELFRTGALSQRWLNNEEVVDVLLNYMNYGFPLSSSFSDRPASGSIFLYDKSVCKRLRADGYAWKREYHVKLKVNGKPTLECYYAHSNDDTLLQRRRYWLLDPAKSNIVLMHYLEHRYLAVAFLLVFTVYQACTREFWRTSSALIFGWYRRQ